MPSKSKAQFGKMAILYRQGKISKKTLEHYNKGVHPDELPAHTSARKPPPRRGKRKA